jgi:hypothetical protein
MCRYSKENSFPNAKKIKLTVNSAKWPTKRVQKKRYGITMEGVDFLEPRF